MTERKVKPYRVRIQFGGAVEYETLAVNTTQAVESALFRFAHDNPRTISSYKDTYVIPSEDNKVYSIVPELLL
jgi:hypothetical protein